jgi:hypothetical protein
MNPVTRALLKQISDQQLEKFAEDWDNLEALVVEIYKQKSLSFEQQEDFFQLQEGLQERYASLREELGLFWPKTKVRGEPVTADPFAALIAKRAAQEFVGNWDAMRTLPAAREALNLMLMARIEKRKSLNK